jgi:hypothetical protein
MARLGRVEYPEDVRWLVIVVLIAIPAIALGKPKIAVAPLENDDDGVTEIVVSAASEVGKVTGPDKVERAMRSADVTSMSGKNLKRLRGKLEVDVVIHGKVARAGRSRILELTISGRNKTKPTIEIDYKNAKTVRKELAARLRKAIATANAGGDDEPDDEEETSSPFKRGGDGGKKDDERERKKRDDDDDSSPFKKDEERERKKRDDEERERKKRDDDERERRKRDDEERERKRKEDESAFRKKKDDDDERDRKKKRRIAEEEEEEEEEDRPRRKRKRARRHPITQAALWLDGGALVARRTLTYSGTGAMQPPSVGTAAPAGRIEGEVYPAAFGSLSGGLAPIGIYGNFTKAFALGIDVPGTNPKVRTPIDNAHYMVGVRYRFTLGPASVAVGASYWRWHYVADRSKLMMPQQLDMPDVDYLAIAPGVLARFPLAPKLVAFAAVDFPLMLNSGPIQANTSFGPSTIIAFDVRAGTQIVLGSHYAVQIAAEVDQVGYKFAGRMGTQAALRGVTKATDRSIGLVATIGVNY